MPLHWLRKKKNVSYDGTKRRVENRIRLKETTIAAALPALPRQSEHRHVVHCTPRSSTLIPAASRRHARRGIVTFITRVVVILSLNGSVRDCTVCTCFAYRRRLQSVIPHLAKRRAISTPPTARHDGTRRYSSSVCDISGRADSISSAPTV